MTAEFIIGAFIGMAIMLLVFIVVALVGVAVDRATDYQFQDDSTQEETWNQRQ